MKKNESCYYISVFFNKSDINLISSIIKIIV